MGFEEDDDDDYEEEGDGANRLFGFMFGNVDDSGDLDADYLDEEAKENLAAVADKLGTSFRDVHSSCSDAAEQDDYDEKAEDAIDYQDIDEQYEGPEEATEEDYLLPRKDYFSTVTAFGNSTGSVYGDENYDEDDDDDDLDEVAEEDGLESSAFADELESEMLAAGETIDEDGLESSAFADELESEMLAAAADTSDSEEEILNEPLPILCVEDETVILRFSEIFGPSLKKERKYPLPKETCKTASIEANVEEDEEAFLRESSSKNIFDVREEQSYSDSGSRQFGAVDKEESDSYHWSEPLGENLPPLDFITPELYHLDQLNWEDAIVWDNSPAHDHSIAESGSESDELVSKSQISKLENQMDFSTWGEPFGSCHEKAFHPQLLRLESGLIQDNPTHVDVENGTDSDKPPGIRHFDKMMLQNRDLMEGSWMDNIVWEPDKPVIKPKLILDLQDEQMLFEISDGEENKHLMIHAGAMIVTRANAGASFDLRGTSEGRFNLSNDESFSKRKSSQQLKADVVKKRTALKNLQTMKKRTAVKLQTMKAAKLKSNKDGANFNRQQKKLKKIEKEQNEVMNKKIKIKSTGGIENVKEKKSVRESFVCGACGQPNHMRTNKLCPNKSGGEPKTSTKKLIQKHDNKFTPEGKISKVKFKCGTAEKLTPGASNNFERPATSDADTGDKAVKVNKIKIIFPNKIKSEVVESPKPAIKPPSEQPLKKIKIKIRLPKEITNVDDVSQEGSDERAASKRKREEEDRRRFEEQRASHLQEQEILAGIRKFEEELSIDAEEEEEERAKKKRKKNIVLLNTNC